MISIRASIATLVAVLIIGGFHALTYFFPITIVPTEGGDSHNSTLESASTSALRNLERPPRIKTPDSVRAIYMTSWVAGSPKLRNELVKLIDETEINSVLLDIKDYTGKISFEPQNEDLRKFQSWEKRIPDIDAFIDELHEKGVYVIGRISVFQDAYMVTHKPEWAVRRRTDAKIWKDYKGVSWIDAGAEQHWNYISLIAREAYDRRFDEINFDYIRFPSDGDMKNIDFPFSGNRPKSEVLTSYFKFVREDLGSLGIPLSADIFGMTTTNTDDLGIGQLLEPALAYFDYVYPMVYPSHYPPNFNGYPKPAEKPYEVIHFSMNRAVERALAASSSPQKLRPWIQDFSIGGTTYTPEMVRAQIQATYDVGLTGWLVWNASNRYTREAYLEHSQSELTQSVGNDHAQ